MPLTDIQKEILRVISKNRSQESHFAGGLILNATDESARFSHDFDIFHETAEAVEKASLEDAALLRSAGFEVLPTQEWEKPETFRKARITKDGQTMEIDWAADSAFRFFPIEQDAEMGWRLHLFDMATNKALALSARSETRDYIDILELGKIYPLSAIIWAACGKDPGFTPLSLLKMMLRFARIRPETLDEIKARELDPIEMKEEWIAMSDEAAEVIERVSNEQPDLPIGCAFLDADFKPCWIEDQKDLQIHFGSLRGCWPSFSEL
ncbi:MAG: hypothetical protein L3J39_02950 [Verrucomicrobiales bacterium]|nr:hypothetical protein [Verrucomicrobiales bacterium]